MAGFLMMPLYGLVLISRSPTRPIGWIIMKLLTVAIKKKQMGSEVSLGPSRGDGVRKALSSQGAFSLSFSLTTASAPLLFIICVHSRIISLIVNKIVFLFILRHFFVRGHLLGCNFSPDNQWDVVNKSREKDTFGEIS